MELQIVKVLQAIGVDIKMVFEYSLLFESQIE